MNAKIRYGLSAAVLALIAVGAPAPDILDQFLDEKEGNHTTAYRDGSGIWTICRGATMVDGKPVFPGMKLSKEKCDQVNAIERDKALAWVERNIKVLLTEPQKAGIASFCPYNIGPGKCFPSTFYKRLNAGDRKGACEAIRWWIKDGGRDCRIRSNNCYGQVIRRDRKRISLLGDRAVSRVAAIIYALVICIIVCLSWAVNHYRDNAIAYKEQRDKKVSELKQAIATIADMQQRQRDVAALDAKYSRELANAKAENETLRADVAAGRRRLHIKAVCQSVREATTASGVDNATSPRLADTAERDYFTLRERLITMQKQLEGTQKYINEQCR